MGCRELIWQKKITAFYYKKTLTKFLSILVFFSNFQTNLIFIFLNLCLGHENVNKFWKKNLKHLLLCWNRFSEILFYKHYRKPTFSTLLQHSTCHQLSENSHNMQFSPKKLSSSELWDSRPIRLIPKKK